MDRQGFDPMVQTLNAVLEFMENVEAAEAFTTVDKKPAAKTIRARSKTLRNEKTVSPTFPLPSAFSMDMDIPRKIAR